TLDQKSECHDRDSRAHPGQIGAFVGGVVAEARDHESAISEKIANALLKRSRFAPRPFAAGWALLPAYNSLAGRRYAAFAFTASACSSSSAARRRSVAPGRSSVMRSLSWPSSL